MNLIAENWQEYEVIDTGDGMKLERWGDFILSRPDPQVIWKPSRPELWAKADAVYNRSSSGGGQWTFRKKLPSQWKIGYRDLKFVIEPMGFKHTGLFPEQAANWDWMRRAAEDRVSEGETVNVLNLFGYTGGATVSLAAGGAAVVHVDASKGMVTRARENVEASGLADRQVRYIVDDAFKFAEREIRRGHKYDGIIMDPPSYGRGPSGEVWHLEDNLYAFVSRCMELLSDRPLFFLLNSYTTGFSSTVTENILRLTAPANLENINKSVYLPCGSYAALTGEGVSVERSAANV